jgi:ABC-type microcin C transport system permease subunit YejE
MNTLKNLFILFIFALCFCWLLITEVYCNNASLTSKVKSHELTPIIDLYTVTQFGIKNMSNYNAYELTITILRIEQQGKYRVGQYEINTAYADVITPFASYPAYKEKNYKIIVEGIHFPKTEWVCLTNQPCRIIVEAIE